LHYLEVEWPSMYRYMHCLDRMGGTVHKRKKSDVKDEIEIEKKVFRFFSYRNTYHWK